MNLDQLAPYLAECPYPNQLAHVDRGILGRGFYPAARGFHNGGNPLGGMMLLGRDWGTQSQYDQWKGLPLRDETAITWTRTRDIHLQAFERFPVWCTNYLLGVRRGGSAVGNLRDEVEPSIWGKYEGYCWAFLQRQVLLQRPKLIAVLGKPNRIDLECENRFDVHAVDFFEHTFIVDGATHRALVAYADHPHSFTNPTVKKRALLKLQMFAQAMTEKRVTSLT